MTEFKKGDPVTVTFDAVVTEMQRDDDYVQVSNPRGGGFMPWAVPATVVTRRVPTPAETPVGSIGKTMNFGNPAVKIAPCSWVLTSTDGSPRSDTVTVYRDGDIDQVLRPA